MLLYLARCQILTGFCSRGAGPGDCAPTGLRRSNGAQCDPRFQCGGAYRVARGFFTSPSVAYGLHGRRGPKRLKDLLHRSPRDFGQERSTWTLELAGQDELGARHHLPRGLQQECAPSAQAAQNQLEAGQALDNQSRSAVPPKKNARDR